MAKLLLIDGHSVLTRAYYGVPTLTSSAGIHTNAVYGFLNILLKCIDDEKAEHVAVAFDLDRRKLKRTALYPEYKGTRKPMPTELLEQVPIAREMVRAMNIPILELEGYEADDLLGTVAKRTQAEGLEVTIVSGDKDLLQLSDEHIKILMPRGGTQFVSYYPEDVKREELVTPSEYIDLKAIKGDASDNIPGLPGIGTKTAPGIIIKYGSIENAYAHREELTPPKVRKAFEEHYELAVLSKQLATIELDAPVDFDPTTLSEGVGDTSGIYTEAALKKLRELELKKLAVRFARKIESGVGTEESTALPDGEVLSTGTGAGKVTGKGYDAHREADTGTGYDTSGEEGQDNNEAISKDTQEKNDNTYGSIDTIGKTTPAAAELDLGKLKAINDPFLAATVLKDAATEPLIGIALYEDSFLGQLRMVLGLALPDERYYVISSGEKYTAERLLSELDTMLRERISAKRLTACLGLKHILKSIDIERNAYIYDISVAAYLMDPGRSSYDYDDLSSAYLGVTQPGTKELLAKATPVEALFNELARDKAEQYIALNAIVPFVCADILTYKLKSAGMFELYTDVELPLIYTLNDMEQAGIAVDRNALDDYAAELKRQIDALTKEIYSLAGETFNINSPSQLGTILFEKLGLSGGKKTKTGYSTAADVLEKLSDEHEIARKILRYRALTKLNSTYATGLTAYIAEDGRIHGTFNQTVTATGRLSSTEPNLQNIPVRTAEGREIRKVFVPQEGYTFVDADYSQVELRILAALSGDPVLIDAYKNALDIHTLTASQVFHVDIDKVTPEMRRNAKAVNFGIVYGISDYGLGEGLSIGRKEAKEYIEQYFKSYPKVKEYLDSQVEYAKEHGFVKTMFGRMRFIPELKASNKMVRNFGERIAMNSPIQGTAADIMKMAMNRTAEALRGKKSRLVLQVHDELLVETAPEELEEVKRILKQSMEEAAKLPVRLAAEVESGDSWYDCH